MTSRQELEQIAELRERLLAKGQSVPQIVEAIVDQFGVSRLKAHRLARGWTRRKAVKVIVATYEADGLHPQKLTPPAAVRMGAQPPHPPWRGLCGPPVPRL